MSLQRAIDLKIFTAAYNRFYEKGRDDMAESVACKLIPAQARHETGNYTSNVFKALNNAFGYGRVKGSQWQNNNTRTNTREGVTYGGYATVEDSARELADYWMRKGRDKDFLNIVDASGYALILKKNGYYTAPLEVYATAMKSWANKVQLGIVIVSVPFIAIIAGACAFLINEII